MIYQNRTAFFNRTVASYKEKESQGLSMPIITASSLRLETYINSKFTKFTFPVLAGVNGTNGNVVQPNEVRLEQNDNFHVDQIGIYLAVTNNPSDTNFRLLTNPNEIFLGSAAIALSYGNLWNGNANINVNQVDVLTNHRVSKHFFVGQTQRLSAAVDNNFDQIDLSENGLLPMEPNIMLSGAYTNTITIQLNNSIDLALADNNSRIVMIFDGLRAQNAAVKLGSVKA